MKHLIPAVLAVAFLAHNTAQADIIYAYFDGKAGGIARVQVETQTGVISAPKPIYLEEASHRLETVRLSEDGQHVVGQNEDETQPHLIIGDLKASAFERVQLSDRPRYTALHQDHILACGHEGKLHLVSMKEKKVLAESNPGQEIKPPAMRQEAVALSPDGRQGFSVHLQDSTSGKARGGRLVVVEIPSLRVQHDLVLPRDHGDLDMPVGSKDRGPLPHDIHIDAGSNTIAIPCRLYGAVAVADLDAALKGEWKNFKYISTAADGSMGTSFPDRGSILEVDGVPYLFISNASTTGGAAFIDLQKRTVAAHVATGPRGLTSGVYLPETKKLLAARTGFQWTRGADKLESGHQDQKELLVIDVAALGLGGEVTHRKITWGDYVYNVGAVPGTERFAVAAVRTEANKLDLVVVDLESGKEVTRTPSLGVLRNFLALNP